MKLLILVSSMHGGGAERVAAILASSWASKGDAVTLMPTFSGRGQCVYPLHPNVELRFLADCVPAEAGRIGRLLGLRREIQTLRPDVIVAFLPHVNVAALLATRGLGIPVIVSERTYPPALEPQPPLAIRALRKVLYRAAHRVVVQTQDVAEWVNSECRGAVPAVIPNPITYPVPAGKPAVFPDQSPAAGRCFVLGAGRMIPSKRFDLLLASFARAAQGRPEWFLVLVGDGPERARLEQLAKELGVADRVWFAGFVGNPGDWYEAASAYVLPSSYEGFPNTLAEAMAYGVPSIAFDIKTGPRDILNNGEDGVLLPDNDHVARLTPPLTRLMDDLAWREYLSSRAARVRTTFSMDNVMQLWNDCVAGARPELHRQDAGTPLERPGS